LQPPQPYNNPPPGSNVLQHPHHANPPPNNGVLRPPAPFIGGSLTPNISHPPFVLAPPGPPPCLDGSIPLPGFNPPPTSEIPRLTPSQTTPQTTTTPQNSSPSDPPPPPAPPAIEQGTRNCLILANFDETAIKSKDVQTQILFNQTFHKIQKPGKSKTETCAITSYPAKFRDPSTGLPYLNSYAFKEIQKLKRGEYRWSKLVGAYVGQGTFAAKGVPPRFLSLKNQQAQQPNGVGVK